MLAAAFSISTDIDYVRGVKICRDQAVDIRREKAERAMRILSELK